MSIIYNGATINKVIYNNMNVNKIILNNVTTWEQAYEEYLTYTLLDDNTYAVSATDVDNMPAEIVIPSTYNGMSVTSVAENAFLDCTSLTGVTIGNNIASIGCGAFDGCTGLTSITIPDNVIEVLEYAFSNCTGLASATIGSGVTRIEDDVFYYCTSLTSITIPDSVTSIGDDVFYYCTSLTSITIPDSVTSIGDDVFRYCPLQSITVDEDNTVYHSKDNCLIKTATNTLILGCKNSIIPDYVTSIGEKAFYGCKSLTSIVIPDSVTSIGDDAFYYCTGITSVTIGNSVTSIGNYAFSGCTGLTNLTIGKGVTSIGSRAFYECTGLTEINYNAENCADLSKDNHAFSSAGIEGNGIKVTIGKDVKKIPEYLFYPYSNNSSGTPKIIEVVFEEGSVCESIGVSAFYSCTALTSITIPDSVTTIGSSAFYNCTGLTSVYYNGTIDEWVKISFSSNDSNPLDCAKNLYINDQLVTEANITTTTKISDYAFYRYDKLTSVTIGNSVKSIGTSAFSNCTGLASATIGSGVTRIEDDAFYNCTGLTSITIPDSVTSIGSDAFDNCTSLTSITIGSGVTYIGDSTFYGCTNLVDVYYNGTTSDWNNITIGGGNECLTNATLHTAGYDLSITFLSSGHYNVGSGAYSVAPCGSISGTAPETIADGEIAKITIAPRQIMGASTTTAAYLDLTVSACTNATYNLVASTSSYNYTLYLTPTGAGDISVFIMEDTSEDED